MKLIMPIISALTLLVLSFTADCYAGDWFSEAEVGAIYLKLPKHGLLRDQNPFPDQAQTVEGDNGEDVGANLSIRLGRILSQPLGTADSTSIEVTGVFANFDDREFESRPEPPGFSAVRSLGFVTQLSHQTTNSAVDILTARDVDFFGSGIALQQHYQVSPHDLVAITGGFSSIHVHQDLHTLIVDSSNAAFVDLSDSIDTNYYGAKLGLGLIHELTGEWVFGLDGALGFYSAKAHYEGAFDSGSFVNDPPLSLSQAEFALGTQVRIELTRQLGERSYARLYGEIQHLNYAPEIRFVNEGLATNPNPLPTRIVDGEMLSAMLGLRIAFFH